MSELQIALIIAGLLLIIGIYCLTKIQERHVRKDEGSAFGAAEQDALLATERYENAERREEPKIASDVALEETRHEPVLGVIIEENFGREQRAFEFEAETRGVRMGDPLISAVEGSLEENGSSPDGEDKNDDGLSLPAIFDSRFDYICGVVSVDPIPGRLVAEAIARLKSDISKPIQCVGVSSKGCEWAPIDEMSRYRYLCVGLQIVDRAGPVTEAELSRFCGDIRSLAEPFEATVDLPATDNVVSRAEAIDDFCADVDLQIGLHVVTKNGNAFNGTKIRALAEASGCMLDDDGLFHRIDIVTGRALFRLYNLGDPPFRPADVKNIKTTELGLSLDLALIAEPVAVFNQMLLFARQLAQTLGGVLVDVNGRTLSDPMVDSIRKQLSVYQDNLSAADIVAGSPLADRLFR